MEQSAAQPPPGGPPSQAPASSGMSAGRIVVLILGGIAALIGVFLLLAGAVLLLVHSEGRDQDGFYTTGTERLSTRAHAITVENIDLGSGSGEAIPKEILGRVRVRAERPNGGPVFVGIGPERDVDAYLRGVSHAKVDDLDPPKYVNSPGGAPRRPPAEENFWVAMAEGPGRQAVTWEVDGGLWTVVAMNADAKARVVLDADVGAKVGWFLGIGIALLVGGLLFLAGGIVMIVAAARSRPT